MIIWYNRGNRKGRFCLILGREKVKKLKKNEEIRNSFDVGGACDAFFGFCSASS